MLGRFPGRKSTFLLNPRIAENDLELHGITCLEKVPSGYD